jgi:hypothetical protein
LIRSPFPYFGGKRDIAAKVWSCFGRPRQYIEPFCGSAAVLLAAPQPALLEVIGDLNGFVANFWRSVVHQYAEVVRWADYPVSHIDLGARHRWLMEQRDRLGAELQDPNWSGDAQVAGWWLWGQCCWIGAGWCEWSGKIPQVSDAGRGVQAAGQIPHVGNAGRGVQAAGQIPHVSTAGMGVQAGQIPRVGMQAIWTSAGRTAQAWLHRLADRLERVRVIHGSWDRCLNHHYGDTATAIFFDPPYDGFEGIYRASQVAREVEAWCRDHAHLRVALCGLRGDYDLDGWTVHEWTRSHSTYAGDKTRDAEAIWFSPACAPPTQRGLFDAA